MSDMNTELEEIRAREAKATPGPWTVQIDKDEDCEACIVAHLSDEHQIWICDCSMPFGENIAERDFIAHARQDIPTLLSHISTLEERIAFLEKVAEQAVKLAGSIRASEIGGFAFTWPQINGNGGAAPFVYSKKEAKELAEYIVAYLRTQGGKS